MRKVSVAMTTYNGELYLEDQLLSIIEQTHKPDEIIICDDKSTDSTVEVIHKIQKKYRLNDSLKLYINKIQKGYIQNFLDCAEKTSGDIIFFCDQDDIWHKEKIRKMLQVFESRENAEAVSCRFSVINEKGEPANRFLNYLRMFPPGVKKANLVYQVRHNHSGGLVLAVKRTFFENVKKIIVENNLTYDVPMGLMASVGGNYYILGTPLVFRRVHQNNVSAPQYSLKSRLKNIQRHIRGQRKHINLLKACLMEYESEITKRNRKLLKKTIHHKESSIDALVDRKILYLLMQCFSINPMINKVLSIANVLCCIFGDYNEIK